MSFLFRGLIGLLALLLPVSAATGSRPSRRTSLPNFVLIVADGLGAAELGTNRTRTLSTPHLDRLATEGLQFTQAYAGAPTAAAARSALLTGQHAGHGRVRSGIQEPLAPEDVTLAEVLRTVGYRNGMLGQWGLGWEQTTGHPIQQGFHEFFGALELFHGADQRTSFLWRNDVAFQLPARTGMVANDLAREWVLRAATNFIRIQEDLAFFLLFSPNLPGRTSADPDRASRLTQLDQQVGVLLTNLTTRNLDGDTLVILTAVPSFVRPGESSTNTLGGRGPWRRGGAGLYEGDLRVPLIAWWPGQIKPATHSLPVAAWDILPTLAALSESPLPPQVDGRSLVPVWTDKIPMTNRPALYWENHAGIQAQAGRIGNWKGIQAGTDSSLELYDLETDPAEGSNVAGEHPQVVAEFEKLFRSLRRPWSPPAEGALQAAGRPGMAIPTNVFRAPMRTNYFPTTGEPR